MLFVVDDAAAASAGFAALMFREGLSDVLLTLVAILLVSEGLVIVSQAEMRSSQRTEPAIALQQGRCCNRVQTS